MDSMKQQQNDNQGTLPPDRVLVFFSYARRDQTLRDHLENHLSILKYRGLITTWHAREISAGQEAIHEIDIHLNAARIILLLISANFLASEYCVSQEMMRALERHERGEASVIPILLRPVLFTGAPFAKLKTLPTNGLPVTQWRDREEAFYSIAQEIERLVLSLRTGVLSTPTIESTIPRARLLPPSVDQTRNFNVDPPSLPPSPPRRTSMRKSSLRLVLPGIGALMLIIFSIAGFLSWGMRNASVPPATPTPLPTFTPTPLPTFTPTPLPTPGLLLPPGLVTLSIIVAVLCLLLLLGVVALLLTRGHRRRAWEFRQLEERQEELRTYYERAFSAYEQALRENSTDATATVGKGNALVGLGRYTEALIAFEESVALAPHPATYVSMGNVLAKLGRNDEAVHAYGQALALDDMYASAYTGLSEALLRLGRTQEAEQASAKAKQLGEED